MSSLPPGSGEVNRKGLLFVCFRVTVIEGFGCVDVSDVLVKDVKPCGDEIWC